MIRLRPYKSCDSKVIVKWLNDEDVFIKWGGERFGKYPISADIIDDKYTKANGDCKEPDNFYPWTAINEDNKVVGHFIMRYTGRDNKQLRFGWVVVDNTLRGKGYGKQMLMKGLKYAFDISWEAAKYAYKYYNDWLKYGEIDYTPYEIELLELFKAA